MPRKRNIETEEAIRQAARKIILEQGFDATTYTALAKATGIARTTIQHYVPFKEALATQLMQDVADLSYEQAIKMLPEGVHPLAIGYFAGQISHAIFYAEEGLRKFLLDISTDRRLQYQIPPNYDKIALGYLGVNTEDVDPKYRDSLIQSLGGIFDVHFVCLREGRFPNTRRLNENVIRTYAHVLDIDTSIIDGIVANYSIETNELRKLGKKLARKLHTA